MEPDIQYIQFLDVVVKRSPDKLAEAMSESMGHVIQRNSGGCSQRRVAELGINQRSKN